VTFLHVISLPSCYLFVFWLLSDPSIGLVKTVLAVCLFVCVCVCVYVCEIELCWVQALTVLMHLGLMALCDP